MAILLGIAASAVALGAARGPSAMANVKAGMWELQGIPGTKAPARSCIADIAQLERYEHRAEHCTLGEVSDTGSSTVVEYSCGAAGFGRSKIDVITPRNLKINTQGISNQLPFNYTLSARRLGDCGK